MTPQLLLLHPSDNILIVVQPLRAGDAVVINGVEHVVAQTLTIGHKVARSALPEGTQIIRYGAPIGSLIAPVVTGDHVHLHNLKSDYIATHDRETVSGGPHD